jgi:mannitol/fructose-specific phosphotransferase system IIA component (Ntr-type)
VISFSSLDSVSHLNTLTELIVLITNKNRVEKIISADSSKEVMKLLAERE